MKKKQTTDQSLKRTVRTTLFRSTLLVASGVIGLFVLGCASEPDSHLVSAPPPPKPTQAVVTTTVVSSPAMVVAPTYAPAATVVPVVNTVIVTQAPPPIQAEVVLAQPSPQHVWIPGFWTWRNQQYEWMAGHWELPPNSGAVWNAPRWEREGNAYRFFEGYWN